MALGQINRLSCLYRRISNNIILRHRTVGSLVFVQSKSTHRGPAIDQDCRVEIGVTSDGRTIVCHHPSEDVPYEITQPISRPDPLISAPETHDQVLKERLSRHSLQDKQAPNIEELSKMFFTTKHRWYPVGQYHLRRRNRNPPKDR